MVVGGKSPRVVSVSLQLPGPQDWTDSLVEEELGERSLLCVGKVGQSTLQCAACPQLGQGPGKVKGRWSSSVTTIFFGEDLRAAFRRWRVSHRKLFLKHSVPCSVAPEELEDRYLLRIFKLNKPCLFLLLF